MRFTDLVLSFPPLLLAIALAATLQPSVESDRCHIGYLVAMVYTPRPR